MKKIVLLLSILFATLGCKAQIIPVEQYITYSGEILDGAYVKDVNGLLNDYVGTWVTTQNGDRYEFQIVKVIKSFLNTTWDMLYMRYKIVNISTGKVIADTTDKTDDSHLVVKGSYLAASGSYVFDYMGLNNECGQNGQVFMGILNTNRSQAKLFLSVTGSVYPSCTSVVATQVLPTEMITLTKQ